MLSASLPRFIIIPFFSISPLPLPLPTSPYFQGDLHWEYSDIDKDSITSTDRQIDAVERAHDDLVRRERCGELGVEARVEEPHCASAGRSERDRCREHREHPPSRDGSAGTGVHVMPAR